MALTPRLDLRQTQSLVMTPQLQQAIKLLQLSALELVEYVGLELERNPLLEQDSEPGESEAAESQAPADDAGAPDRDVSESAELANQGTLPDDAQAPLDVDYGNVWESEEIREGPAQFADWGRGGSPRFDDPDSAVDQTLGHEKSLRDHLLDQIAMDLDDPATRLIAVHLVDMLDESGYLTGDLRAVAETLGCDIARVESVLEKLQHFDPPGLFACDLAQCLALQLRDRGRLDPAMEAMLAHLDLVARGDMRALMKLCGVDAEDIAEMTAEIRALNPKPGLAFDGMIAQAVIPDVIMRPLPKGGWSVELNNDTLPRLLVNNSYYAKVTREARTKEDKDYISACFQSANWLVKSLHQRATTILKVATEIVRQQDAFFLHGVQRLRPLVLRDIAEAIGMHESTVSRVTTNKYMATPRGILELKYFFSSSIAATGGEAISAEAVRHRIKNLIEKESAKEILSDDQIVDLLRKEGMDIARRTVAKYREAMRIPSSIERRRQKSARI
ncbi:MAG: RNA polymerase factor sigma-54 [Alphaproteobacteria bacterium]